MPTYLHKSPAKQSSEAIEVANAKLDKLLVNSKQLGSAKQVSSSISRKAFSVVSSEVRKRLKTTATEAKASKNVAICAQHFDVQSTPSQSTLAL